MQISFYSIYGLIDHLKCLGSSCKPGYENKYRVEVRKNAAGLIRQMSIFRFPFVIKAYYFSDGGLIWHLPLLRKTEFRQYIFLKHQTTLVTPSNSEFFFCWFGSTDVDKKQKNSNCFPLVKMSPLISVYLLCVIQTNQENGSCFSLNSKFSRDVKMIDLHNVFRIFSCHFRVLFIAPMVIEFCSPRTRKSCNE